MKLVGKNFKFYFKIFLIFNLALFFEGIYKHYQFLFKKISISYFYDDQAGYTKLIWHENGLIENIQIFFLLLSIIFFIYFLRKNRLINFKISKYIFMLYLLGLIYYFLEEISWGQHIFNWSTPYFFFNLNNQNETNFHNISNLFNQLPRNLVFIWSAFTFIIVKLSFVKNFRQIRQFIFPSQNLKYISIFLIIITFPSILIESFLPAYGIKEGDIGQIYIIFQNAIIYKPELSQIILVLFLDIISFKFIRLSELQELIFNYYTLSHSYYLIKISSKSI